MSKHSIISHTVYCISTSAFIRPITRQKETKGLRLQQQQFKTSVSAACLCSSLWGIWLDKIYTSCSLDYRSDDIKQIFVTWIVTRTAALHPGFGLNWTKGPWTRVCIIIHSSFLMSKCVFFLTARVPMWDTPCSQDTVPVHVAEYVDKSILLPQSLYQSVYLAFNDKSSWWCCCVAVVGDLRNAITGIVQDLLCRDTQKKTHAYIVCSLNIQLIEHWPVLSYLLSHLMWMVQRVLSF